MKKDKTPVLLKVVRWWFPKLERFAPSIANRFFVKVFFTPLRYAVPEKEKETLASAKKFTIQILDKNIQCYSWGTGPLVLLVHGWAGRPTQFRKFITRLVDAGYEVVGFDGPAHGASDGRRTNIKEFEAVIKKLYELKGKPKAIITHSFGGSAVLYSAMNGLPVSKLINIASPVIADDIIRTYLKAINGSWKTAEFFKSYILDTQGKPFEEFTAEHFIRNLRQPIQLLLVHDEDDKDVGIHQAEALIKLYSKAKLFRTKGLGHTRILKDDNVIDICVTFISSEAS